MTETQVKPEAATEVRGLTAAELKTLEKLLLKANIGNMHGPAVQVGKPYVALTWLSVPRREQADPKDRQTDRVAPGETIYLTDDEAAKFLRHGPQDGRRVAVIRAKNEVDQNNVPKPHPSLLSGLPFRASAPIPGTDMPRPDPAGASRIIESNVPPEMQVPQEGRGGTPSIQDAMDIVPGTGEIARQEIRAGADQDLMAAVKSQAGLNKQPKE